MPDRLASQSSPTGGQLLCIRYHQQRVVLLARQRSSARHNTRRALTDTVTVTSSWPPYWCTTVKPKGCERAFVYHATASRGSVTARYVICVRRGTKHPISRALFHCTLYGMAGGSKEREWSTAHFSYSVSLTSRQLYRNSKECVQQVRWSCEL